MTRTKTDVHAERELGGIWFLTTFLDFASDFAVKAETIDYVETGDGGFSQVILELPSGQKWRIEVERVDEATS